MGKVCVECGSEWVVNKTHCLCDKCNYYRLHKETRFEANLRKQKSKPNKLHRFYAKRGKKRTETSEKRKLVLIKDRETYLEVFNIKPHYCEECILNRVHTPLPTNFEDNEGNIIAIWQYSHILSKGAFPEYRHNYINFNRLCFKHHQQWDFGDKQSMKIYIPNQKIIERLKGVKI